MLGALKRAAFDLLEMPQVIGFLLKVTLQDTSGVLSGMGLNRDGKREVIQKELYFVVQGEMNYCSSSSKTVNFY